MLTSEVPFPGENFVAVAMRHINEEPPPVREKRPDVSPRLDAAIRRAMAKRPERPRSDDGGLRGRASGVPRRDAVGGDADRRAAPLGTQQTTQIRITAAARCHRGR